MGLLSCCTHDASSHKHLTHQCEPHMLRPFTFITWRFPHIPHPSHTHQHEPHTPHIHITHIYTVHTTPFHIQHSRTSTYTTSLTQTHINTSLIPYTHTYHTQQHSTQHISSHLTPLDFHIHCLPPKTSYLTQSPPQIQTHESYISHNTPLHKCTL